MCVAGEKQAIMSYLNANRLEKFGRYPLMLLDSGVESPVYNTFLEGFFSPELRLINSGGAACSYGMFGQPEINGSLRES